MTILNLSKEGRQALNKLARRKNPNYHFVNDEQFISLIVFLKRNTSSCLICNKEVGNYSKIIDEHGFFTSKNLI